MTPLFILIVCTTLFSLRLLYNVFGHGLSTYPGPLAAKFSDIWRMWEVIAMRQPYTFRRLHERLGPAVRVGPNSISLSDPALLDAVFGYKSDFLKSDFVKPWTPIKDGKRIPGMVDSQDKKVHAQLRRPVANVYSMTNIVSAEPFIDNTIKDFLKQIDTRFAGKRQAFDIENWVQYFAFDVVGEVTFSRRLGFLEEGKDINGMLHTLEAMSSYRSIIGAMPWVDNIIKTNPLHLYISPSTPIVDKAVSLAQDRAKSPPSDDRQDMFSRFQEVKKAHPETVTDSSVLRYILTNLFAGSDTTAVVLRTIIYYTLKTPAVHARLQVELDEAKLTYPVSWKAAQNLPYLSAVIKESFRIHPVLGFSLERIVPQEGLDLPDGRKIPARSIVSMSAWTLHFDPVFGEDVDAFNPDRWLQCKDESCAKWQERLNAMHKADFSFSYGSRVCLGRHLATMEVYKLIPTLFGLLDMELVDPRKPWTVESRFFTKQKDMNIYARWREGVDISMVIDL